MALVFCDGFEQYSTATAFTSSSNQLQYVAAPTNQNYGWILSAGTTVIATSTANEYRTAQTGTAKGLKISAGSLTCKLPTPGTLIVGFGFRINSLSANANLCTFSSTGLTADDWGLRFRVLTTGAVDFYNESTNASIVASSTGQIAINTWYYIELKIIFGVAGSVEARINEGTVCSQSVVDTMCGTTSTRCFHLSNSSTNTVCFDDLYICDTTGSANNDFLGAIGVYSLFPTANGTTNNFTAVGGAGSNYQSVNTITATTTTYVESGTSGDKELYALQDLPVSLTTVNGVMVGGRVQDVSTNSQTQNFGIKTSGTEAYGANKKGTAGSWVNITEVFEKQADGSTSWDTTAVNAMEAGIKNT